MELPRPSSPSRPDTQVIASGWLPVAGVRLRALTLAHALALLLLVTWGYGGQTPWVRQAIALGSVPGIALLVARWWIRARAGGGGFAREAMRLWPLWALDVLASVSLANPSFQDLWRDGQAMMASIRPWPWLPSTARPAVTAATLWQLNGLVLTAWNLWAVIGTRRQARAVLAFAGANAVALAVFGTWQHLRHATGIWFGHTPVPNPEFFATFIYRNHWGAFMLLYLGAFLGWVCTGRGAWRTPSVRWAAVACLLLAVTAPLSGSRSTSVLALLLLAAAVAVIVFRIRRERESRSLLPPVALLLGLAAAGATWGGYVARDAVAARYRLTRAQVAAAWADPSTVSRITLYRDVGRMAAAKPWFGWGPGSFPYVFRWFNTQRSIENMPGRPFYMEAHSDWLQSLAETGVIGTLLRLALAAACMAGSWRSAWKQDLSRGLLAGCAVVIAYAALEFPFANPAVVFSFWLAWCGAARWARLAAAPMSRSARA